MAVLDPHAALGAAEVGPGRALPQGPGPQSPQRGGQRTAASGWRGGGCHRPHGKPCWPMRSGPWEFTPATSPRPRTTRPSSGACRGPSRRCDEKANACGTSPQSQPRTHTPPPHRTSVRAPTLAAPTAPQEPCAPCSMTRLALQQTAPSPNPDTKPATAAGRRAKPRPEDTKRTGSQKKPTHTPTGTATPNGARPKPAAVETA